jgi:hypothetical protein
MTSHSESAVLHKPSNQDAPRGGLLKLGAVAAASALLGGIAAAWWYRKTLQKLHETGENNNNPHFGIGSAHVDEETADDV